MKGDFEDEQDYFNDEEYKNYVKGGEYEDILKNYNKGGEYDDILKNYKNIDLNSLNEKGIEKEEIDKPVKIKKKNKKAKKQKMAEEDDWKTSSD